LDVCGQQSPALKRWAIVKDKYRDDGDGKNRACRRGVWSYSFSSHENAFGQGENCEVAVCFHCAILIAMSSVQEIEAVIPKLSRAEVEEVRAWIDDFLEDQMELNDDVKAKLDQSRREITEGNYTTRQPK
jgi:hypothetical protein